MPKANKFDHVASASVLNKIHERRQDFYCDLKQSENKFFALGMFPYPSGNAHMGHVLVYSLTDVVARLAKLKGRNVLNPIGWDSFGLPAENAAIKMNVDPASWTTLNIDRMKNEQFRDMGWAFDKTKEFSTCDPLYYANTQRLFLKLLERGLAYQKEGLVNWDPVDQTVLADEQVIDGKSWRSGAPVEKRWMKQWFFRIEPYRERLWEDLNKLEGWAESAIAVQRNWINKSIGINVDFTLQSGETLSAFTTRVDTLYGVSAVVLAPEHEICRRICREEPDSSVAKYIQGSYARSAVDRVSQERSGVSTGLTCFHPLTGEGIPVFVGDYVLGGTGTGVVMCTPAHDERDFEFAKNLSLPVRIVVQPEDGEEKLPFTGDGVLINSENMSGLTSSEARGVLSKLLINLERGSEATHFNLKDWSVGRQRFWGAPIPIVNCDSCGPVPVPAEQLPVRLPEHVEIVNGKRSLANVPEFVNTECPCCSGPAKRETDTLDTFVCSSWYSFRFLDPKNDGDLFDPETTSKWMPLDFYVGGLEHAAQHMIYFRYITKVLHDAGMISFDEPVRNFYCNGIIKKDGFKMSKSRGNVVVPTEIVEKYGGDALRMYVLSDTPADLDREWDDSGIEAKRNFIGKTYRIIADYLDITAAENSGAVAESFSNVRFLRGFYSGINQFDKAITSRSFNGAVARLHELTKLIQNEASNVSAHSANDRGAFRQILKQYLVVASVLAPYMTETLYYEYFDKEQGIYSQNWPEFDPQLLHTESVDIVVQFNGKKKGLISVPRDAKKEDIDALLHGDDYFKDKFDGKEVKKVIYVQDRFINFVF